MIHIQIAPERHEGHGFHAEIQKVFDRLYVSSPRAFESSASRIHSDFSPPLPLIAASISRRSASISRTENPGRRYCFFVILGRPIFFVGIFLYYTNPLTRSAFV